MPALRVPFFDRTRADLAREAELTAAFQRVLRSGRYILGDEVAAFERAVAARLGAAHAVGVSAGTDALVIALHALGVGPGDEVICPAYTFFATVGAVLRTGARPVLVDVEPEGLLIDPSAVATRIRPETRAIVAVHLFGRAADLDGLARVTSVPIVEDAAQAFGAALDERPLGSIGALGCFSLFPTKNLGAFGDGGLVVTSDASLADRARALRGHGMIEKHLATLAGGGNYRLDALQAALLSVTLPHLDAALARRRAIADRYHDGLRDVGEALALPSFPAGASVNQYVVSARGEGARDRLRVFLAERGVGTEIYYPRPLHLLPVLASLGHREGDFPVSEAASRETLALPIFPELREDEIDHVVAQIRAFFGR